MESVATTTAVSLPTSACMGLVTTSLRGASNIHVKKDVKSFLFKHSFHSVGGFMSF
jgi:hypothetical protein